MKLSTTIDEQIEKFLSRGMVICNINKTKTILSNVCYYRLSSYSFPFEILYPATEGRDHKYLPDTNFDDVYQLYNFDFEIRSILLKYLPIIETALKTTIINIVSNKYIKSGTWFIDPEVVKYGFIIWFDKNVYNDTFKLNNTIKRHHKKYINDKYAPAWKTIEFMTLGAVINLFVAIKDDSLKREIAMKFRVRSLRIFVNYLESVRDLRNFCAHGSVLFDLRLNKGLAKGPATPDFETAMKTSIQGVIKVVEYFLESVSPSLKNNFVKDILRILMKYKTNSSVKNILEKCSGL